MAGRPRKAAALKIIEGAPGHSPIELGPAPIEPIGPPPPYLSEEECEYWEVLSAEWGPILQSTHRPAFEHLCTQMALRDELQADVNRHGRYDEHNGKTVPSAAHRMLEDVRKDLFRMWQVFGVTPTTQGKVPGNSIKPHRARKGGLELLSGKGNE